MYINESGTEIRLYRSEDYETISQWWEYAGEPAVPKDFIPDTSFVLTYNNTPVLALSLFLTNCKGACWLEGFVGNPDFEGPARREAAQALVDYACNVAAALNYTRVFCLADKEALSNRYEELGMTRTIDACASVFVRNIDLNAFAEKVAALNKGIN